MTVLTFPHRDYDADMQALADQLRRNTHLVIATNRTTGEVLSQHARPRGDAVEYAATWARTLGPGWTAKAMPVRKRLT
jgi:hypothetical protein